jgi:two-component system phosphate regulon response regulator PhoB/two-component system alkaline phosphatase synthesis response regulator PhoP
VILDLMLPDLMGTEICKKIRNNPKTEQLAIIMLTAKTDEIDKVLGLELGADDYLTKPFSPRELVARVNAILRRTKTEKPVQVEQDEIFLTENFRIVPNRYLVFVDDEEIRLTKTEFNILHILATRKGWVYSRDQLLESLWGDEKIVTGRTIDVHIKNLRAKLKSAGAYIENIVGVGYKLKV